MTVFQRIQELCDANNIAISTLESTLGFAHSSLTNMEKANIRSDRLLVIANYFNVSTDWLLTGQEHGQQTYILTDQEKSLIKLFRNLDPTGQQLMLSQYGVYANAGLVKKENDSNKVVKAVLDALA